MTNKIRINRLGGIDRRVVHAAVKEGSHHGGSGGGYGYGYEMTTKKILLIEDDEQMRNATKRALGDVFLRHEIVTAANALAGVKAARDPAVVAVVTDNALPFQQGTEMKECAADICKIISQHVPHLKQGPFYVFSSEVRPKCRADLERITQDSGAFIHVSKDKGAQELEKIIADMKMKLAPSHLPTDHKDHPAHPEGAPPGGLGI